MPTDARALLRKHGLFAKKSWGQNFLVDERTFRAIVDAAAIGDGDWVIEIGAGVGTLTERLAVPAAKVIAVERDRDMIALLRAEHGANERIEIVDQNALTYEYGAVEARAGRPPIVVGNLPYQIATPILFRLLDARAHLRRIVIMLQREMAERIVAPPDTSEYGALGVMVRMLSEPSIVCRVPAGAFHPAPRVGSAVLRLELFPGATTRAPVADLRRFRAVVRAAFGQRRKTLRNALRAIAGDTDVDAAFAAASIDGRRRGETLDVAEFARLADALPLALPAGGPAADPDPV